jgi:hypothetical protein
MMSKIVDDPRFSGPVITCIQDLQSSNLNDLDLIPSSLARAREETASPRELRKSAVFPLPQAGERARRC